MRRIVLALSGVFVLAFAAGPSAQEPAADALPRADGTSVEARSAESSTVEQATTSLFVTDTAGQPIAGARVSGYHIMRTSTDAEGRAEIEVVDGTQAARLLVEAPGFAHEHVWLRHSKPSRVRMMRAASLSGRVLDAETGLPVADATVRFPPHGPLEGFPLCAHPTCETDASGTYRFGEIPTERSSWFQISAADYPSVEFCFELDRASYHDFLLDRGVRVRGHVVDLETRAPIRAWTSGGPTDPEGGFEFRQVPCEIDGSVEFAVSPEGDRSMYCPLRVRLNPGDLTDSVLVPVPRGIPLVGRVLDQEGNPIKAAWITIDARPGGRLPPDGIRPTWTVSDVARQCESDLEGRFTTGALVPWIDHRIWASKPGYRGSAVQVTPQGLERDPRVALVLERFPPGGAIEGRVSLNRDPVKGSVRWSNQMRAGSVPIGAYGDYRLEDVGPGAVRLCARLSSPEEGAWFPSGADFEAIVDVEAGEITRHDFDLHLAMSTISGRIVTAAGCSMEALEVRARGWDDVEPGCAFSGLCDAEGAYRIDVADMPAPYVVSFPYGDTQQRSEPIAAGTRGVDFVVPDLGTVRFRAVDATTGRPLSDFERWWRPTGEPLFREDSFSDAPGPEGWREARLPSGSIDLLFRADWLGYQHVLVIGLKLAADCELEVEARMQRGFSLELVPAPGVAAFPGDHLVVLVEEELWDEAAVKCLERYTTFQPCELFPGHRLSRRGVWLRAPSRPVRLTGLAPGRYRFKVFPDDLEITPERIELTETPDEPVEIRWKWR